MREMITACKEAKVHLGIGYRCQFEPHHLECMELARSKAFGNIKYIEAGFGFRAGDPNQWRLKKALAGGGALMDVGIYALQACRYLTGEEPAEITAQETKTDPVKFAEVDETITWSMKFPSGVVANCSTTYNFNGVNRFRAYAEKGDFGMDPAFNYSGNKASSSRGPIQKEARSVCYGNGRVCENDLDERAKSSSWRRRLRDLLAIEAIYKSIKEGNKVTPATV